MVHFNNLIGKKIGILGGMGPEATVRLFDRIVQLTPAKKDQDHLQIVIINNPKIPDRTAAIMEGKESPVISIQSGLDTLNDLGAQVIAIPCVSSHYFFDDLEIPPNITLLNILQETAQYTINHLAGVKAVAVLGTDLTVNKNLFGEFFGLQKVATIYPTGKEQKDIVMNSIYQIKGGEYILPRNQLKIVANSLVRQGAEAIIAGCTEIPLALKPCDITIPLINTIDCLAKAVIREALQDQNNNFQSHPGENNIER